MNNKQEDQKVVHKLGVEKKDKKDNKYQYFTYFFIFVIFLITLLESSSSHIGRGQGYIIADFIFKSLTKTGDVLIFYAILRWIFKKTKIKAWFFATLIEIIFLLITLIITSSGEASKSELLLAIENENLTPAEQIDKGFLELLSLYPNEDVCLKTGYNTPIELNACYTVLGRVTSDVAYCNKVEAVSKSHCLLYVKYWKQEESVCKTSIDESDICYQIIAVKKQNIALCDSISSAEIKSLCKSLIK